MSIRNVSKRILTLILIIFQLTFVGCSNTPNEVEMPNSQNEIDGQNPDSTITKEKVVFHFMGIDLNPKNFSKDETDFMKELEWQTNVQVIWDLVPQSSWAEKKKLTLASGILPDAFYGVGSLTGEEVQRLGSNGTLIPLNDLVKNYAPNIQTVLEENEFFRTVTTSMDGNIYALANLEETGIDSHMVSIIKKEWLDHLNLSMPTTTDEFYAVLKAFKEKDPNGNGLQDEIPFSFLYSENSSINREVKREHAFLFGAFGINDSPRHISIQDNGEVIFTADKERWKEAVKYLHRLYAEGLIDPEVFTQDRKLLTEKIMNNKNIGAYSDFRLKWSSVLEEDFDKYALMPPLEGPYGDRSWDRAIYGMTEGTLAITSTCQDPKTLMKWLNHTLEPENTIQMQYGMFQTNPDKYREKRYLIPSATDPGKWDTNDNLVPPEVNPSEWEWSSPIASGYVIIPQNVLDKYIATKLSLNAKQEDCAVYRPYLTKYPYNYPFKFSDDEIDKLALIQSDLLNYIYKTQARWIVDGNIDSEWDTYLTELKKHKVDAYIQIFKTAFERSK